MTVPNENECLLLFQTIRDESGRPDVRLQWSPGGISRGAYYNATTGAIALDPNALERVATEAGCGLRQVMAWSLAHEMGHVRQHTAGMDLSEHGADEWASYLSARHGWDPDGRIRSVVQRRRSARRLQWVSGRSSGTVGQTPTLQRGGVYRARGIVPVQTSIPAIIAGMEALGFGSGRVFLEPPPPIETAGGIPWPANRGALPDPEPGFRVLFLEAIFSEASGDPTAEEWFGPGARTLDAWQQVAAGNELVLIEALAPDQPAEPPPPPDPELPDVPAPSTTSTKKKSSSAVPVVVGSALLGGISWGLWRAFGAGA